MLRRTAARILAAILLTTTLFIPAAPAYASACGGQATDWVPTLLASDWYIEAFFNGDPRNGDVAFTYSGQLAVTTFLDPTSVGDGQYNPDEANDSLIWYTADIFDTGDRYTFVATADSCNAGNTKVLDASGPVIQYNVGQVGVFYITRVI